MSELYNADKFQRSLSASPTIGPMTYTAPELNNIAALSLEQQKGLLQALQTLIHPSTQPKLEQIDEQEKQHEDIHGVDSMEEKNEPDGSEPTE